MGVSKLLGSDLCKLYHLLEGVANQILVVMSMHCLSFEKAAQYLALKQICSVSWHVALVFELLLTRRPPPIVEKKRGKGLDKSQILRV